MKNNDFIRINEADNVAVALKAVVRGGEAFGLTVEETVPAGHKVALADIPQGGDVIKYGYPIGRAVKAIAAGQHVHTHNLETCVTARCDYDYAPEDPEPLEPKTGALWGYERSDGSFGIRNEVWIINTVGCVNKSAERIAAEANRLYAGRVDGVYAITHPHGCSQLGGDHEAARRILAGLAKHPNAGGVLIFGLGCENNDIEGFKDVLGDYDDERVKFLTAQEHEDEEKAALELVEGLIGYAARAKRCEMGFDKLIIGMKCGGSDGFSGITANPLAGCIADMLRHYGGTTVLTETPEMFGAETILMNRCESFGLFQKTVSMINGFKAYFVRHGQEVYENPSPGNKEGGITTQEEKSLGCVQKGGRGIVTDVLGYGERVRTPGLTLLDGPGNDLVSMTALVAAGAHIILFTTGRGTPAGAYVPTIKIASNSELAARKARWIDFDAGVLLEGRPEEEVAEDLWHLILAVAEGRANTKNELYGCRETAILKDGVTL